MTKKSPHITHSISAIGGIFLVPALVLCLGTPARAQSASPDSGNSVQGNEGSANGEAQFDRFLGEHRDIAEQLRRDPALINNDEFVENHPPLQTFLEQEPKVRDELRENPNAFLWRHDDPFMRHLEERNTDLTRDHLASFGGFLGNHADVSRQLSKDPALVTNLDYLKNHYELRDYLDSHPDVRDEMLQNPQFFVKSAEGFSSNDTSTNAR